MPVVQHATHSPTEKWWGLVCFDHTGFERFRYRPYSILPSGPDWDAVSVVLGAASVGGLFQVSLGNAAHRVTALSSIMPAFMDFPGDAAIIGNINLALYDLPQ